MKRIFIYFSLTGNGDLISEHLKDEYDIRKIEMKKRFPKSFFFRIMKGGFLASINAKTKLKEFDNDIKDYENIVIGSPIWNARLSSPINTLLSKLDLNGKKVTFVFYSGSGEAPKAIEKVKKNYNIDKIIVLKEPIKYNEELKKLDELRSNTNE